MWFEMINTLIAAAGLGLAAAPIFKKVVGFESPNPHRFVSNSQWVTLNLRRKRNLNYARNGGLS